MSILSTILLYKHGHVWLYKCFNAAPIAVRSGCKGVASAVQTTTATAAASIKHCSLQLLTSASSAVPRIVCDLRYSLRSTNTRRVVL